MKTLGFLLQKEFIQIFRNKIMARMIFLVPLVQLIILVPAITFDIKEVRLCVLDQDQSALSRELVRKLQGTRFFTLSGTPFSEAEALDYIDQDRADLVLSIPAGLERDHYRAEGPKVQILANAINGNFAQLAYVYTVQVIQDLNLQLAKEKGLKGSEGPHIQNHYWYNAEMNYKYYMLPGILVILVIAIGFLLSGLNLVREKESGTSEQINVTPVRKADLILSKLIPFIVIALLELAFGLLLGRWLYGIPFRGSIMLLFAFALVFVIAVLGMGLFLSTLANTQQQFMFIAFFCMMIFILMSGIFTPTESMPQWAQEFNVVNPVAYFMRVIRMVMLKGSGFRDIIPEFTGLAILALSMNTFAVLWYRKRV